MTLKNGKEDTYYLNPAKDKLVAAKVEVFAVGIGEHINENALKLIASDTSHVFKIEDGRGLLEKILKSTETPCLTGNDDFQGEIHFFFFIRTHFIRTLKLRLPKN